MKKAFLFLLISLGTPLAALAQDAIFRCGNEYTNNATEAKSRGCKLVQGGNVTVIAAPKPGVRVASANPSSAGQKVEASEQKSRDSDARSILESELRRTQDRQADMLREYNNGEPEKQGAETRNHQKYLDRVAALKAGIARNEEDIAGLKRELSRLQGPAAAQR